MADYSLVTVAHSVDLPLLKVQARSLSRYLDRSFVKQIVVIDNTVGGALPKDELLPQYGGLPVKLIKASEVASVPPGTTGWFTQQVYKLAVASIIPTKRYIVLDAKNHLIDHMPKGAFEAPDGRIRTGCHGYERHTLRRYLVRCCDYLGVPHSAVMLRFLPTTPPFTMETEKVRELIRYMVKREKRSFVDSFLQRGLTEFFLYGAFLISQGHKLDDFYKFDTWFGSTLWKEDDNAKMQGVIANPSKLFFAVHRSSFKNMDSVTQDKLAHFWLDRKLFGSYSDALRFVRGCAITYK